MPISATFVADFSAFTAAMDKAEVQLRSFETNVAKIDRTLSKFGNEFSGTKIIQDAMAMSKAIEAVGGASALTEKELQRAGATAKEAAEKMKALGMDVPKGISDLASHVKEAGTFAEGATESFKGMFSAFALGQVAADAFEK